MEEIHKTLELGVQQAEKYQRDVQEISNNYHARLLSAVVEAAKPTNVEYLPDIIGIGNTSLSTNANILQNGANHSIDNVFMSQKATINGNMNESKCCDSFCQPMSMMSIAEEEAAESMILKNEELRSK